MTLIKNQIPILEHDTHKQAVIMPRRELSGRTPKKCVFAFLGDEVELYAKKHCCERIGEFDSITKTYPIYRTIHKGQEICICQAPMGAPAAVQILDYLIGQGVTEIIACGSCGVLEDFPENEFLIPSSALRDEGTSYHYLPPDREIVLDKEGIEAVERSFEKNKIPFRHCKTWSTDGFYRETRQMVEYRREEGFHVVEMECSALAACARFRGVIFGQFLFTADSLADLDAHDYRNFGEDSISIAMGLSLDAVWEIGKPVGDKITSLYFVRHGIPDDSVEDTRLRPLTREGEKDSKRLETVLSTLPDGFDAFVSSPYNRSVQTIEPLAERFHKDIVKLEGLGERVIGKLEAISMRGFFFKQWKDFTYKEKEGECLLEVQKRNMAVIQELLTGYEGKNVVIGTHSTALSTILSYYDETFGYEDFMDLVYCLPYVIRLDFKGETYLGREELLKEEKSLIHPDMFTIEYLTPETIDFSLFQNFNRYQKVTKCFRREEGKWVIKDVPFIEEWSESDLEYLAQCLKHTLLSGGRVAACFDGKALVGFFSVESALFGSSSQYAMLTSLHTAYEYRGLGLGKRLFYEACLSAGDLGAHKLYISSHSAVETQAFYKKMGCVEAEEYNAEAVEKEPCDRQLECDIRRFLSRFTMKK